MEGERKRQREGSNLVDRGEEGEGTEKLHTATKEEEKEGELKGKKSDGLKEEETAYGKSDKEKREEI